jgi:hypothetical protein
MSDPSAFKDELGGKAGADSPQSKAKAKKIESSAAVSLHFPPATADPTPHLAPFKDEDSAYAVVVKACLQLSYYAGTGSSVQIEDSTTVASSALFHDPSYAKIASSCFAALVECIQNHHDRRARILSCKTLAIMSRAAYARIRPSPLVFSMRDATINRLEDEVGTEIPTALVTAALEDEDDGVSASAVEALGLMTLSSSATPGSLVEDELLREMQSIAFCRVSPYAPSLRAVVDEDPSIPQAELQARIYENILAPRLLHLVDRVVRYQSTSHIMVALPCLTACLVHQVKTTPSLVYGMDRPTFAKRWLELDAAGLVDTLVSSCILPAMQSPIDGSSLGHAAALCGLRLANACPNAPWVPHVGRWAAAVLKEQLAGQALETKLATLAAIVIALRAVPLQERTGALIGLAEDVGDLPSTSLAPHGVTSPGVLIDWNEVKEYRRPARVGMWTEIALSFFMDGPSVDEASSRGDYLKSFFSSAPVSKLLGETDRPGIPLCRNELLLVFCTVAVNTGRRFRVAADGSLHVTDPNALEVGEWLKLAWTVLTVFVSCLHTGPKSNYMAEDLSLVTAGLAAYVKLVQEYIHLVGLLDPATSVALKLTANACPPHLLWDQLAESSSFLSKFETVDMGDLDNTTKLMDEVVAREGKNGIRSHHMRLLLLTLAADHWVQGRVVGIRKQFEAATSSAAGTLTLNLQSGRDIVLALNPKRLLTKVFEAHVSPADSADGKKKKDPIKKLATETVRACVACIENIALTACDWRRRFGAGQESSKLVSVAVGVLQGKGDNTPTDETVKAVMAPLCEAAVARIQAFYESGSGGGLDQPFPASILVTPPVKAKIKPLVSSSKAQSVKRDDYLSAYLMQLSRQIISSRIEQSVESSPPANSLLSAARPKTWLRLAVPPIPESRDARKFGHFVEPMAAWGRSVAASSASSDATSLVLACTPRRCLRYDGEEEFRTAVLLRAYNITAIEFTEGIRLRLGVVQQEDGPFESDDPVTRDIADSLGGQLSDLIESKALVSAEVVYKQEFKSGEYVTWEVGLNSVPVGSNIAVLPSIVYRNIEVEADEVGGKWVSGDKLPGGDGSTAGGESNSGEDDFQVTSDSGTKSGEEKVTDNICVPGEPMVMSPFTGMQPCPLVFFRDGWGDVDTFRFLWFRMSFQLAPIRIVPTSGDQDFARSNDSMGRKVCEMASLTWDGEAIPGGFATRIWAYMTLSGQRVFGVLAESDSDAGGEDAPKPTALYLRGDDRSLLFSLVGSKAGREAIVSTLVPGMSPFG